MSDFIPIAVDLFGDDQYAINHAEQYDDYIEYRVRGYHASLAFRRVWGDEQYGAQGHVKIDRIEHGSYYRSHFTKRLKEIKIDELWNTKTSVHELLSLTRDIFAKDTARLNAIKELNVLVGITVVDENGKTKAGRGLNDFYEQNGIEATPKQETAKE
jgi:hypothetical protein